MPAATVDKTADAVIRLKLETLPEDAAPAAKVDAEEMVPPLEFAPADAGAEDLIQPNDDDDIAQTDSLAWDLAMAAPQDGLIRLAGGDDAVRDVPPASGNAKGAAAGALKTSDTAGAATGKPPGDGGK